MKKILFTLMICATLCLFGCQDNDSINEYSIERITDLSNELENKIVSAYKKENKTDKEYQLMIDDCYLFNDGCCFFFAHGLYNTYHYNVSEEVSNYKFIYPNSNNLLVLLNNDVMSMSDAFNNNHIDEKRIEVLFETYQSQYISLYQDDILTFDYNLMLKIKQEYASKNEIDDLNKIQISNFYGVYNNAIVLKIYNNYYDVITTEKILDIEFTYTTSVKISVYKDGKFYDLKKAYEENLITYDNLLEIHKISNL